MSKQVDVNVVDWKGVAAPAMTGDAYALIGATGSGLTSLASATELAKVPKSDGAVTWNNTALASINAEVDTALNTAIPLVNTADSINDVILDQVKAKLPTNYIMGKLCSNCKGWNNRRYPH